MMETKRVLVTRPQRQGEALCRKLEQLGFATQLVPVLAIEALSSVKAQQQIADTFSRIHSYQGIIVVSLNAAEQALPWLRRINSATMPAFYTVGKTTARFLQQALNIQARFPEQQMDSEGLLALPELQELHAQRFLILRGEGGRELIARSLQQRGARVDSCSLYRRYCPEQHAAELHRAIPGTDILLINSVESLQNFQKLAGTLTLDKHCHLLVPGQRVAETARQAGFNHIICADNATDEALIAALVQAFPREDLPCD
jgi:uroporphyrinogen-III synthase